MEIFEVSSNWIMALGKTLFYSLWIGVLYLSLLKIGYLVIAPRYATYRYRFASAILLLFIASVAILFSVLYTPVRDASGTISTGIRLIDPVFQDVGREYGWQKTICYLSTYIYFTGILAYLLHTIASIRSVHSIRKGGKPAGKQWQKRFKEFNERVGIRMRTLLLVSDQTRSPFLAGIVKPVIIVPTGMLTHLSFSQVESILMHELFHLKRLDHLANVFQRIIEILFFYNPAVWSISRTIRRERENCCDDLVLRECSQPLDYASALYQLALDQGKSPALAPAATGDSRGQLKTRIQRILNPSTMKTNIHEKLSALLLLTGGFLIVVMLSGFSSAFSITQFNQDTDDIIQPEPSSMPNPVVQPEPSPQPHPVIQPEPSPLPNPVMQPDTLSEPAKTAPCEVDIDWEEIGKEIEEAMSTAMEDIDWEAIKKDMEAAKQTVMEDIDWETIQKEMEAAKQTVMEDIDWDQFKDDIEMARIHIDSVMKDFHLDMEEFKLEMENLDF